MKKKFTAENASENSKRPDLYKAIMQDKYELALTLIKQGVGTLYIKPKGYYYAEPQDGWNLFHAIEMKKVFLGNNAALNAVNEALTTALNGPEYMNVRLQGKGHNLVQALKNTPDENGYVPGSVIGDTRNIKSNDFFIKNNDVWQFNHFKFGLKEVGNQKIFTNFLNYLNEVTLGFEEDMCTEIFQLSSKQVMGQMKNTDDAIQYTLNFQVAHRIEQQAQQELEQAERIAAAAEEQERADAVRQEQAIAAELNYQAALRLQNGDGPHQAAHQAAPAPVAAMPNAIPRGQQITDLEGLVEHLSVLSDMLITRDMAQEILQAFDNEEDVVTGLTGHQIIAFFFE